MTEMVKIYESAYGSKIHLNAMCSRLGNTFHRKITEEKFKELVCEGRFCRKCVPDRMREMFEEGSE